MMNSLKREIGTRIVSMLCVAMSVAFGLLVSGSNASAQSPKVVRIAGKDYPVSTFVGQTPQTTAATQPATESSNATTSQSNSAQPQKDAAPVAPAARPIATPQQAAAVEPKPAQLAITQSKPASKPEAKPTIELTTSTPCIEGVAVVDAESVELVFADLNPKSREQLDGYFSLPEVNLELIRDMFESQVNAPSPSTSPFVMASHSLDGLGLSEVNDQVASGPSIATTALLQSQQPTQEDREKRAVETLLKSINSPQTNLMQMQSVDFPQWVGQIQFAMLRYGSHTDLNLQDAIYTAIQFSPEIEILRADVGISQAEITKQQAGFDWGTFVQSNWDEKNVPVSSTLDGTFARLENHTLANSLGVTRRNSLGGNIKLAQDLGLADSNSQFFNPQNQANARLGLDLQQPLLQGAGLLTTRSRINIAIVNAAATQEQFIGGLQAHILNVIQAYWELSAARGQFVIAKRSYERALETATVVSNRVHLDVGPVQSARSEATLGARRAALMRNEYAVVLAQEKLLRLMFGQSFRENVNTEVIPTSSMVGPSRNVDMDLELQLGLQCRPEVRQSLQVIKRTSIEQGVARNQLLPLLGLTMSVSNKGLRGNNGLGSAFDDQFNFSNPTYGVGVAYALPVGNRAARANLRQAQMRLVRFQKEFETVVSNVALDIRNACHNVANATQQREATAQAMKLVERELNVLKSRAELLLDGDNVGPLYLEDLLATQERLATAESAFLNASATHAVAYFELQRANGSLMRAEPLTADQTMNP